MTTNQLQAVKKQFAVKKKIIVKFNSVKPNGKSEGDIDTLPTTFTVPTIQINTISF